MNVIDESGLLAISTRLQRLAERLRKDGTLIYKACDIDFEPKWFPVIYTLHFKPLLSVVELAAEIGYTHPSTISLLQELEKQELILSGRDKVDQRKRLIMLTDKGTALIERMKPVWQIMKDAISEFTNTKNNLMEAIMEVEEQLDQQSFFQRARGRLPGGN
jgi:DNA-binding MarR family transcriptional regulator